MKNSSYGFIVTALSVAMMLSACARPQTSVERHASGFLYQQGRYRPDVAAVIQAVL